MTVERIVLAFAGIVILVTVALAHFLGQSWILLITGFVGLNLFQSAFTGFCPLAMILKKMGKENGPAF
jgi:hypothetical protein